MTNGENLKIMFELKQEDKSRTMLFNSLILLLNEYKFYKNELVEDMQTDIDIEVMNNMLEKAKTIIDLMKVEVKV